jgi:hypothetical protein
MNSSLLPRQSRLKHFVRNSAKSGGNWSATSDSGLRTSDRAGIGSDVCGAGTVEGCCGPLLTLSRARFSFIFLKAIFARRDPLPRPSELRHVRRHSLWRLLRRVRGSANCCHFGGHGRNVRFAPPRRRHHSFLKAATRRSDCSRRSSSTEMRRRVAASINAAES